MKVPPATLPKDRPHKFLKKWFIDAVLNFHLSDPPKVPVVQLIDVRLHQTGPI